MSDDINDVIEKADILCKNFKNEKDPCESIDIIPKLIAEIKRLREQASALNDSVTQISSMLKTFVLSSSNRTYFALNTAEQWIYQYEKQCERICKMQELIDWQTDNAKKWKEHDQDQHDEIEQWKGRYNDQAIRLSDLETYKKDTQKLIPLCKKLFGLSSRIELMLEESSYGEYRRQRDEVVDRSIAQQAKIHKQHIAIRKLREKQLRSKGKL